MRSRKSARLSSGVALNPGPILPKVCLICNKTNFYYSDPHDKKRKCQGLSQAETLDGGRLRQAAEYKNDVNILRQICDRDLVAIEACYHKNCYKECVRNVPIQEAEIDVVDDDAVGDDSNNFDYRKSYVFFTDIIEQRLIKHNKVYSLKSLCEAFVKIVERTQNIDASTYQTKRLKKKIKDCLLYTSPSPRDATLSRMPSSA